MLPYNFGASSGPRPAVMGGKMVHSNLVNNNNVRGKSQDSPRHRRGGNYERSNTAMGVFGPEVPKIAVGIS